MIDILNYYIFFHDRPYVQFLKLTGRIKEQFKIENGKYIVPAPLEVKKWKILSNFIIYFLSLHSMTYFSLSFFLFISLSLSHTFSLSISLYLSLFISLSLSLPLPPSLYLSSSLSLFIPLCLSFSSSSSFPFSHVLSFIGRIYLHTLISFSILLHN